MDNSETFEEFYAQVSKCAEKHGLSSELVTTAPPATLIIVNEKVGGQLFDVGGFALYWRNGDQIVSWQAHGERENKESMHSTLQKIPQIIEYFAAHAEAQRQKDWLATLINVYSEMRKLQTENALTMTGDSLDSAEAKQIFDSSLFIADHQIPPIRVVISKHPRRYGIITAKNEKLQPQNEREFLVVLHEAVLELLAMRVPSRQS